MDQPSADSRYGQLSRATKCREPRPFTILEFPEDAALEVDDGNNPFVLICCTIVGSRQNRYFCFPYFLAMRILHLVIPRHEHPAVLVTKADYFWIFNIGSNLGVFVSEPLRESLNGETRCSKTHGDRLG
jgi:hypothetical protein